MLVKLASDMLVMITPFLADSLFGILPQAYVPRTLDVQLTLQQLIEL